MPRAPRTACGNRTCPNLRPCPDHPSRRPPRQQRGYDSRHDALRAQWKPQVEQGLVDCAEPVCLMPIRRILPGQSWHLCHDRKTGQHLGPGHARCNTSEGGKAAHHAR